MAREMSTAQPASPEAAKSKLADVKSLEDVMFKVSFPVSLKDDSR